MPVAIWAGRACRGATSAPRALQMTLESIPTCGREPAWDTGISFVTTGSRCCGRLPMPGRFLDSFLTTAGAHRELPRGAHEVLVERADPSKSRRDFGSCSTTSPARALYE